MLNTHAWSLSGWPELLWQADRLMEMPIRLRHLYTRVAANATPWNESTGHTLWAGRTGPGDVGMVWDWIALPRGVVALADPMSVVSNLRWVDAQGQPLPAGQAAVFTNRLVHSLPWQEQVHLVLRASEPACEPCD